jgi:hypothetical protein
MGVATSLHIEVVGSAVTAVGAAFMDALAAGTYVAAAGWALAAIAAVAFLPARTATAPQGQPGVPAKPTSRRPRAV